MLCRLFSLDSWTHWNRSPTLQTFKDEALFHPPKEAPTVSFLVQKGHEFSSFSFHQFYQLNWSLSVLKQVVYSNYLSFVYLLPQKQSQKACFLGLFWAHFPKKSLGIFGKFSSKFLNLFMKDSSILKY